MMKKIFRTIHLWLSVPFGLIVSLVCFSGAMLVFEEEISEFSRPHLYRVETAVDTPLPLAQMLERVEAALPDTVSITGVSVPADSSRTCRVSLSKPRRASLYVDPYTGEIKGSNERLPFFQVMFRLHRWLLDSMRPDGAVFWGKVIVGTSTLVFVFVLLSGMVVWWPRTSRALRNGLSIAVSKGKRRFWYDLHVVGGAYAFVFLLAMSLTGLTWSFSWYRAAFYKAFGVEERSGGRGQSSSRHSESFSYISWQRVVEELAAQNRGYREISVSHGSASVAFPRFGNQRAADRYVFRPSDGQITETVLYKDAGNAAKIRGWIYSVHTGSWGGLPTRILSFMAALLGASLPITGYWLWIKRAWGRRHRPLA